MKSHKQKFTVLYYIDNDSNKIDIRSVKGYGYKYKGIKYFIYKLSSIKWEINEYITGLRICETSLLTKDDARENAKKQIDTIGTKKLNESIRNVQKLFKKYNASSITQISCNFKHKK